MIALALTVSLAAAPNVRVTYELKCLYCHSEDMAEGVKLTEPGWVKLVERMRRKAPLLITRRDVKVIARFMARDKGLSPKQKPAPTSAAATGFEPPAMPEPEPPDEPLKVPSAAEPAATEPEADPALEQQAFTVLQQRCSKCHTVSRVYTKLDGLERSLVVIERMQLKTGSGITDKDVELLQKFVRAQFAE